MPLSLHQHQLKEWVTVEGGRCFGNQASCLKPLLHCLVHIETESSFLWLQEESDSLDFQVFQHSQKNLVVGGSPTLTECNTHFASTGEQPALFLLPMRRVCAVSGRRGGTFLGCMPNFTSTACLHGAWAPVAHVYPQAQPQWDDSCHPHIHMAPRGTSQT